MTRYPNAVWVPGPEWKQYVTPLSPSGAVLHSMAGWKPGAYSRLFGSAQASWQFSVYLDGSVEQHYDTLASCWHSNDMEANLAYWGIEHEGRQPENPTLTSPQIVSTAALLRWLWQEHSIRDGWRQGNTLWEHGWLTHSSCPDGRIPWYELEAALMEEETMTEEQVRAIAVKVLDELGPSLVSSILEAMFTDQAKQPWLFNKLREVIEAVAERGER